MSSRVQDWFVSPAGWPAAKTVLVADVVIFGGGSVCAGLLVLRGHRHSGRFCLALIGVAAYATLVSVAWIPKPVDRSLGAVVMVGALLATTLSAAQANVGNEAGKR